MEPKELVTNKLLVWVSPLSFISKWLLKERNGTESNGTKRLGYPSFTRTAKIGPIFVSIDTPHLHETQNRMHYLE